MRLPVVLALVVAVHAAGQSSPPPSGHRPLRVAGIAPRVTMIPDRTFARSHAIWGATGQDSRGHIWFGVTASEIDVASAHLYEYLPDTGQLIDRGDVVTELARAGIRHAGEQQAKIHSRIIEGPDRHLYFASMDEAGENPDGSRLPTWGGHLWRLDLATNRWEHLQATREALIALAAGDRFVYALGYFGHVLYQFDTRTRVTRRVEIGSVDGHITRNFLADARGHVYVPRLRARTVNGERAVDVSLVEFGIGLEEIAETPIERERYLGSSSPTDAHGIVGLQAMTDGSIFFTTHTGFLFRVVPPGAAPGRPLDHRPAHVMAVGWIHPDGQSYPASLFTPDGTSTLLSVARRDGDPIGAPYQWLRCDTALQSCGVSALVSPDLDLRTNPPALYGSSTRDGNGRHYVVGIWRRPDGEYKPLILEIR